MVDLWRDFWVCETRKGQQVAQLHERYMMMMMVIISFIFVHSVITNIISSVTSNTVITINVIIICVCIVITII